MDNKKLVNITVSLLLLLGVSLLIVLIIPMLVCKPYEADTSTVSVNSYMTPAEIEALYNTATERDTIRLGDDEPLTLEYVLHTWFTDTYSNTAYVGSCQVVENYVSTDKEHQETFDKVVDKYGYVNTLYSALESICTEKKIDFNTIHLCSTYGCNRTDIKVFNLRIGDALYKAAVCILDTNAENEVTVIFSEMPEEDE